MIATNGKSFQTLIAISTGITVSLLVSQPIGFSMMPGAGQHVVDDPELGVEHPRPGGRGDDARHDPGDQRHDADDAAAAEVLVEQDRGRDAEDHLEDDRAEHPVDGVAERLRRDPRLQHGGEVLEADEVALVVGDAEQPGVGDRVGDQHERAR